MFQLPQNLVACIFNCSINKIKMLVCLMLDEMSIKLKLEFDKLEEKLVGLENSGHVRTEKLRNTHSVLLSMELALIIGY